MTAIALTQARSSIEIQDAIGRQHERISRLAAGVEAMGTMMCMNQATAGTMGEKALTDIGLMMFETGRIIRESLADIESYEQQLDVLREECK